MTAPQNHPWNRPREGPPLPCHPSRCGKCGAIVAIEVRNGRTVDYCLGCERNRARADMGLPALSYCPVAVEFDALAERRAVRHVAYLARVLLLVPTDGRRAQSTPALAAVMHRSVSAAHTVLHDLQREGRVASFKRMTRGKTARFWYAVRGERRVA